MKIFCSRPISEKLKDQIADFDFTSATDDEYLKTPAFSVLLDFLGEAYKNDEHIMDLIDSGWLKISEIEYICTVKKSLNLAQNQYGQTIIDNGTAGVILTCVVYSSIINKFFRYLIAIVNEHVVKCAVIGKLPAIYAKRTCNVNDDGRVGTDLSSHLRPNDVVCVYDIIGENKLFVMNKMLNDSNALIATSSWVMLKSNAGTKGKENDWLLTPTGGIKAISMKIPKSNQKITVLKDGTREEVLNSLNKTKAYRENMDVAHEIQVRMTKSVTDSLSGNLEYIPIIDIPDYRKMKNYMKMMDVLNKIGHRLTPEWFTKAEQESLNQVKRIELEDGYFCTVWKTNKAVKHSGTDITQGGGKATIYVINNGTRVVGYWSIGLDHKDGSEMLGIIARNLDAQFSNLMVRNISELNMVDDLDLSIVKSADNNKGFRFAYILQSIYNNRYRCNPFDIRELNNNTKVFTPYPVAVGTKFDGTIPEEFDAQFENNTFARQVFTNLSKHMDSHDEKASTKYKMGSDEARKVAWSRALSLFDFKPAQYLNELMNNSNINVTELKNDLSVLKPVFDGDFRIEVIDVGYLYPRYADHRVKVIRNNEGDTCGYVIHGYYICEADVGIKGAYIVDSRGKQNTIVTQAFVHVEADVTINFNKMTGVSSLHPDATYENYVEEKYRCTGLTLGIKCLRDMQTYIERAMMAYSFSGSFSDGGSINCDRILGSSEDYKYNCISVGKAVFGPSGNDDCDFLRGLTYMKSLALKETVKFEVTNYSKIFSSKEDKMIIGIINGVFVLKAAETWLPLKDKVAALNLSRNADDLVFGLHYGAEVFRYWRCLMRNGEDRKSVYMTVAACVAASFDYIVNAYSTYAEITSQYDFEQVSLDKVKKPEDFYNMSAIQRTRLTHLIDEVAANNSIASGVKQARNWTMRTLRILIDCIALIDFCIKTDGGTYKNNAISEEMIDSIANVSGVDDEDIDYDSYYEELETEEEDEETLGDEYYDYGDVEDGVEVQSDTADVEYDTSEDDTEYEDELEAAYADYDESGEELDEELEEEVETDEEIEYDYGDDGEDEFELTEEQLADDTLGSFTDENGVLITWVEVMHAICEADPGMNALMNDYNSLKMLWQSSYMEAAAKGQVQQALMALWNNIKK